MFIKWRKKKQAYINQNPELKNKIVMHRVSHVTGNKEKEFAKILRKWDAREVTEEIMQSLVNIEETI